MIIHNHAYLFIVFITLICLLLIINPLTIQVSGTYNRRDYCGIPPYPETIPDLPVLSNPLFLQHGIKLIDHYAFMRHATRAPLTKTCFQNTPESDATRNTATCSNTMSMWHSGLDHRPMERSTTTSTPCATNDRRLPRTKQYDIPFAPIQNQQVLLGKCHLGQITDVGIKQAYNEGLRIGRYLNAAYAINRDVSNNNQNNNNNKKPILTEENFKLRTTDIPRTRETMIGWLTGVFDELPDARRNPKNIPAVGWVDTDNDSILLKGGSGMCPELGYLQEVYNNATYITMRNNVVAPLNLILQQILNEPNADISTVFDCIKTSQCNGQPLPQGLAQHADAVDNAITWFWKHAFGHNFIKSSQILSGPILIELSQLFVRSILKTPEVHNRPTIHSFVGVDIGPVMNLLSVFITGNNNNNINNEFFWPPYMASLNVEFYRTNTPIPGSNTLSLVRFLWQGQVVVPHFCTQFIVGQELCPSKVLMDFISTVLPRRGQCPGYPTYDWYTIRNNMVNSLEFNNVQSTQPQLADALHTVYNTLTSQLSVQPSVGTTFRTLNAVLLGTEKDGGVDDETIDTNNNIQVLQQHDGQLLSSLQSKRAVATKSQSTAAISASPVLLSSVNLQEQQQEILYVENNMKNTNNNDDLPPFEELLKMFDGSYFG